jgi:hypothetical protein
VYTGSISAPVTGILCEAGQSFKLRNYAKFGLSSGYQPDTGGWCLYNPNSGVGADRWVQALACGSGMGKYEGYEAIPVPASAGLKAGAAFIGDFVTGLFLTADGYNNTISWNLLPATAWRDPTYQPDPTHKFSLLAQYAWTVEDAGNGTISLKSVSHGMCFTYDNNNGHIAVCDGSYGPTQGQSLFWSTDGTSWHGWEQGRMPF